MMSLIIFKAAGSPPAPRSERCRGTNSAKTEGGICSLTLAHSLSLLWTSKFLTAPLLKFLDHQLGKLLCIKWKRRDVKLKRLQEPHGHNWPGSFLSIQPSPSDNPVHILSSHSCLSCPQSSTTTGIHAVKIINNCSHVAWSSVGVGANTCLGEAELSVNSPFCQFYSWAWMWQHPSAPSQCWLQREHQLGLLKYILG